MSDTGDLHTFRPLETPARCVEMFTGAGRRRSWSAEDKSAIVAESFTGGVTVSGVARRHGLTASQLFAWRRAVRHQMAARDQEGPRFVPAVLEPSSEPVRRRRLLKQRQAGYLAKAKDAEEQAAKAKYERTRDALYKIAACYRDLATMAKNSRL